MAEAGAVSWMFHKKGDIVIPKSAAKEDDLMAIVIEAGGEDLRDDGDNWEILTEPSAFEGVLEAVKKAKYEPSSSGVMMIPQNYIKLEGSAASTMIRLMEALEEHVFLPLIPSLSLRWQIYAVDLRGHGKSSHVRGGYHGTEYAADVAALLAERVSQPAVIFGHSLGGMIGMWTAAHHPDLVRALILGDNMILSTKLPTGYPSLFAALRDLARSGASVEELAHGLARIRIRVPGTDEAMDLGELPGNDEAYLRSWARYLQQVDPEAYEMTLDGSSIEGWDGEEVMKQIQCPTLLLQASPSLGGMMSDNDVQRACALLAHPVRVRFPTLGHASPSRSGRLRRPLKRRAEPRTVQRSRGKSLGPSGRRVRQSDHGRVEL